MCSFGNGSGRNKKGKREYFNNPLIRKLVTALEASFETEIEIPRIRHGKRQTIETVVYEEALLFAKSLRDTKSIWIPRIPSLVF